VRGQCRRSRPAPWRCWGQQRARELSRLFGRSRRAADEASIWGTVWLHYVGGIAAFDAGSTGRGTKGGWGVDGRIGAAEGDRQAAPTVEKQPFGGSAPPGIFSRRSHVARPHNIIG